MGVKIDDDTVAGPVSSPARPSGPVPKTRWASLLGSRALRLVLVTELLVAVAVALGLWTLRQQTLEAELRHLSSLAGAMAAQADATLDAADAALRATRDELARGLLKPGTEDADALLRARITGLPRFRALTVVDNAGTGVASSKLGPADTDSFAMRDFFIAARDAAPGSLFVSLPYIAKAGGQPAIGVATDWRDAAGKFKGVIVLEADPEFLDRDFTRLAPSPDTRMAIYRRDLALVADGPGDNSRDLVPDALASDLWADTEFSKARAMRLADGDVRLVAARPLKRSQMLLVVSRDQDEALDAWSNQALLVGAFAASALIVTLLLSLRNAREQELRRATQAALAAEQSRSMRAFQAAQEGAWEWDTSTQQTYLSPRMKELLGLQRDAPVTGGLLVRETLHPDDLEPLRAALLAHQQGQTGSFDHVFRVRRPGGGWQHVRSRGLALRGTDAVLFSGTATDVSDDVRAREERAQLEEQLGRARRLEALGTLAGGVAHDFNNILASVVGYGELARDAAGNDPAQARRLDQVLQAGQRGKALVEHILAFSRGTPRQRVPFLLQPVVEEVLQLLEASLPPGVWLVRKLEAPAAVVRGDATAVFEAAMNLCTNGIQAMPQGGCLTVTLEPYEATEEALLFQGRLAPGRFARLRVQDQGAGIEPVALPHLFEPFFTTKGAGQTAAPTAHRGTGLGLAVVHGVVADLGGAIDVSSVPGKGARFDLYLPLSADEVPALPAPPHGDAVPMGNGEHVLVVDDEPTLVALAEELLAGLGYEPFGVSSGEEALARFQAEPDRFELLLTDEVMPGFTGTALATALHAARPRLPVVLASGWGGPQFEQRAAAAGITVVVNKPLTRVELARALARALRG